MDKTVYEAIIEALVEKLKAVSCLSEYYREGRDKAEAELDKLQGQYNELKKKYDDLTF